MPIDPSGLYWVVGLPNGLPASSLSVAADGSAAQLSLQDLQVIDEPAFPKPGPVHQAVNSIDVQWRASGPAQTLTDPAKHFSIQGRPAEITAHFSVSQPSTGFSFRGSATSVTYAFLGEEVNGYFFDTPTADQVVMPIPVDAPDTGGGSAAAVDNSGLYVAGGAALLGAVVAGSVAVGRHRSGPQAGPDGGFA